MMIDTVRLKAPCQHVPFGDRHIKTQKIESQRHRRRWYHPVSVDGAYPNCRLTVRSVGQGKYLLVEGSLAKFFQGHNVFGSTDLFALCLEALEVVTRKLGIKPTAQERRAWKRGRIALQRVDITRSFRVGSALIAKAVLREIALSLLLRGKKIDSEYEWETVYYRKRSRRHSMRFYGKGLELEAPGHTLPKDLYLRDRVKAYADPLVRVEVVLRSMELGKLSLVWLEDWKQQDIAQLWRAYFEKLTLKGSIRRRLPDHLIEKLSPSELRAYQLWCHGHPLEEYHSAPTVHKLAKKFLKLGIDLSVPRRAGHQRVSLAKLLSEEALTNRPRFAKGTSLYFRPSAMSATVEGSE